MSCGYKRLSVICAYLVFIIQAVLGGDSYVTEKLPYADITFEPIVGFIDSYIVPKLKANKFSTGELDICIKYDEGMRLDEVAINITHSSQNLPSECYEYGKGYSLYGTTIGGYDFRIWTKVGLKYLKEIPGRYNVEGAYIDDIRGVLDGAFGIVFNIFEDKIVNLCYDLNYYSSYEGCGSKWDFGIPKEFPQAEDGRSVELCNDGIRAAFADSLGPSRISPPQFAPPAEPLPVPLLPKKKR
ncbi:MAG: hypothetical protein JFR39_06645 [Muribaculaceae bacterium]|nr:hypothetical protein [Muribaculaceae bacterium]